MLIKPGMRKKPPLIRTGQISLCNNPTFFNTCNQKVPIMYENPMDLPEGLLRFSLENRER